MVWCSSFPVTTCQRATLALSILAEKKQKFDLILTDVHMPDMDGFKLLEHVGLDLNLPVVMMSADKDVKLATRVLEHGACYCLMKPFCLNELRNIWQHVVRWQKALRKGKSAEDSEHNKATVEEEECYSSIEAGNYRQPKRKKEGKGCEDEHEEEEDEDSAYKKPRMVWSAELHAQFLKTIEELGFERAVPKKILELMNVPGLTRENIASHLQKFRLYIRRLNGADQPLPPTSSSIFSSGPIPPNLLPSAVKDQASPPKVSDQCDPMMPEPEWEGGAGNMESCSLPMFMTSINSAHSQHDIQQQRVVDFVDYAMPSNQVGMDCNESTQWPLFSSGQTGGQSNLWSIVDVGSIGVSESSPVGNYTGFMLTTTGGLQGLTLSGSSGEPSNAINSRNNEMGPDISLGIGITESNMRDLSNPYFDAFDYGYSNQEADFRRQADADGLLSHLLLSLPFDEESRGDRPGKQQQQDAVQLTETDLDISLFHLDNGGQAE
ncbi:hypothetical protein ACLOJK_032855 [Asimina triloba]